MNFGQALELLKRGKKAARGGWNGKGMFIEMGKPYVVSHDDTECRTSLPFIQMKTADGNYVPWLASQTDMLAEDWAIVG